MRAPEEALHEKTLYSAHEDILTTGRHNDERQLRRRKKEYSGFCARGGQKSCGKITTVTQLLALSTPAVITAKPRAAGEDLCLLTQNKKLRKQRQSMTSLSILRQPQHLLFYKKIKTLFGIYLVDLFGLCTVHVAISPANSQQRARARVSLDYI